MRTFLIIYLTLLSMPLFADSWQTGKITTYARIFEGRRCANGSRFSHRRYVVACRRGNFGRRIAIRYGKNGYCEVTLVDRGRLPLHSDSCWQFDTTHAVARKLGLYKIVNGKTDRNISWRFIDGSTTQSDLLDRHPTGPDPMGSVDRLARFLKSTSESDQRVVCWIAYYSMARYVFHRNRLPGSKDQKVLSLYDLRGSALGQPECRWFQSSRT